MKYCASCQSSYPLDYTACPKDQSPLQLLTDLPPGMILRGKYEIIQKLGAGGMGSVYKARHVAFGEMRAVKFVSDHLLADQKALSRFRAEAVLARKLQHPNAVKVEDIDTTDDGRPFIVMEFVPGRSMRDLFADPAGVTTKRILALARQACSALAAAHALGIVHRDIKPENMMVVTAEDGTETLKIADFGLAKVREGFELAPGSAHTQTGFIVGTPPYMSPEQASGTDVDGRSDIYSLGIVLYELFTGRLPFQSDTPIGMLMHHIQTPPVAPQGLGAPKALADFLEKTLAKKREDRFETAEKMDEALRLLSLMPLPEFVGQGIREGFNPNWTGSIHASKLTTIQASTPPKAGAAGRPGAQDPRQASTRSLPASGARPRTVVKRSEAPAPEEASRSIPWGLVIAAGLVAAWFIMNRSGEDPAQADSVPSSPAVAATPAPAQPAERLPAPPAAAAERTDAAIRFDIDRVLGDSTPLREARIQVEVANGVATLMGEAPSETAAQLATTLAGTVPGVRQVFTTLQVPVQAQSQTAGGAAPAAAAEGPPAARTEAAGPPPGLPPLPEDANTAEVRRLLEQAKQKMDARNPDAALADFEAVLKLEPNNTLAKDMLERLKNRPQGPPPRPR